MKEKKKKEDEKEEWKERRKKEGGQERDTGEVIIYWINTERKIKNICLSIVEIHSHILILLTGLNQKPQPTPFTVPLTHSLLLSHLS